LSRKEFHTWVEKFSSRNWVFLTSYATTGFSEGLCFVVARSSLRIVINHLTASSQTLYGFLGPYSTSCSFIWQTFELLPCKAGLLSWSSHDSCYKVTHYMFVYRLCYVGRPECAEASSHDQGYLAYINNARSLGEVMLLTPSAVTWSVLRITVV
jgi:fluoride ion exporter CrcB/FEX